MISMSFYKYNDLVGSVSEPIKRIRIVCVALDDYTAQNNLPDRQLSFRKDEKFEVLDNTSSNSCTSWWFAKSLSTHLAGYIPSNYVTPGLDT